MTLAPDRRGVLAGLAALPALSLPALADSSEYAMGDIVMGDENATLTVYEYASYTCPHCARFHINEWPKLKEAYVDTGKIRFVLREVYFDKEGLWASMTARCGGEKGFYPMAEVFLQTQSTWTRAPDVGSAIQQIGRRAGLSSDRISACLSDREYAKSLVESYQANVGAHGVNATPTFVIDDEKFEGIPTFDELSKALDAAL